jgi:hypothetical protein
MRLLKDQYRPTLEFLEQRELPASSLQASLFSGYLYIQDWTANDTINVAQTNGKISVANTTITAGNSHLSSVSVSSVNEVDIFSYGGGATIDLHVSDTTQLAVTAHVLAHGGHNTILGGSGNEWLYGYDGYNGIYAGNGQNDLLGFGGHNTLVGGTNYNVLYGYGGNNTLYGKSGTTYLNSESATPSDTLVGGAGTNWYFRPVNLSQPFANGENVTDVVEGRAPLCQTDSALADAAKQGINLASRIHYIGNCYYQVQLYGAPTQTVYFDGHYNDTDAQVAAGSQSFWPILFMRARLQALGISPSAEYTTAQWDALNQKLGGRLYSVNDALSMFTGKATTTIAINQSNVQSLANSLNAGHLVVASSYSQSGVSSDGIIGNHAYAVLSVFYQNGSWKVRLYNPWGKDSVNGRTMDSLQTNSVPSNDGIITLRWSQFTNPANFHSYTVA